MDISINNLGGNSSPSVSSLISQLVSKRTQSLNSLLDQKSQIESSLAALQSGALGIGSINNSYSQQIASLQDTIDRLNEQYSINANKITTINSLKKSYSSTVSSLEKYIESLKNPNSSNSDLDIYLNGDKVSSNDKVDVTINDKNTNIQEITLGVTQIATTSTLKSNVLLGGLATINTKVTDLFAGIFDAANNSIKTNRQDLKESLKLKELGVTSGSFNIGSATITVDAENDTIGTLIQKINAAGYSASIETTSFDENGEAVGRLVIDGSADQSISITNQTSNFTALMGLTVSEGNFYINGAEFKITADTTLGSLMKEINSASADNVGAKLEDGKLVFVASETGAVDINVEKGTSNFTNAIGFTIGGVMNQSNLVLGSDGSYVTLTGQNDSVSLSDSVANGKFTEGNFNIYYNTVDEHGNVSDTLTKVTIEIGANDTIETIIQKIKDRTAGSYVNEEGQTVQTGLTADVVNGHLVIRQVQKGAEFDLSIEAGSSNFTNYVGMTTNVSNTTSKDAENSYILGTTVVPNSGFSEGSFIISTNKLSDDGKTALFEKVSAIIEVTSSDTAQTIADKITNAGIGLTASITSDGHFKIQQNNSGADFDITITAGGTDFTEKAGLTSNVINTGVLSPGSDVSQFTTLTGASSINGNTAVSEGTININGITINISAGTISSAIDEINAQKDLTGVSAYIKDGKLVLQANKTGPDFSIKVEAGSSDLAEVAGLVSKVESIGTVGETDSKTTLTAANSVTESTAVKEGTFIINGVTVNINAGTVGSAIDDINSYSEQTGVTAYLKDGKVVLEANETGSDFSIKVEAGNSDFGFVTGFVTKVSPTNSTSVNASKTTLTGANTVNGATSVTEGTFKINGVTVQINAGDINSAIADINKYSSQTGFTAVLRDGNVVLEANKTGSSYSIYVEGGTSNFGTVAGFISDSDSSATATVGQEGSKTTLTGAYDVTEDMQISAGTIKINGLTINIEEGTLKEVIEQINSYSDKTGVVASIKNGKFVLTNTENGDMSINVIDGTSNLGELTGISSYQTEVGREEIVGATQTTMTASKSGLSKSDVIGDSVIMINGQTINLSQDIGHAIDQINAYTNMTGVEAYLDTQGRFVLRNIAAGSHTINFKDISGDFTRVIGAASSSTTGGSSSQQGGISASVVGGIDGLTESTSIIGGGNLVINGTSVSLDGLTSIGDVIDKINSSNLGVTASLNEDGQFKIEANENGKSVSASYSGNGNFGYVTGLGTYTIGSSGAENDGVITGSENIGTNYGNNGLILGTNVVETGHISEEEALAQGYTVIKTAQDLQNMKNNLSGKYILMNDIDLSSIDNWTAIGGLTTNAFTGVFDGNGYTISNLTMSNTTAQVNSDEIFYGLFGYTSGAEISNVTLKNAQFTIGIEGNSKSDSLATVAGSLIGLAENTTVYNVSVVDGAIWNQGNSSNYGFHGEAIGGLIGGVNGNTTIERSSSDIVIYSASAYTGGLVGTVGSSSSLSIIDSYAKNSYNISSDTYSFGGLVGFLGGVTDIDIKNTYVYASVDCSADLFPGGIIGYGVDNGSSVSVTNSYYNNNFEESNGDGVNMGGTYLTDDKFKTQSSFVGWDDTIWDFSGNTPTLKSQNSGSAQIKGGTVVINGVEITLSKGDINSALSEINDKTDLTGVTASIDKYGRVQLKNNTGIDDIGLLEGTSDFFDVAGIDPSKHTAAPANDSQPTIIQGNRDVTGDMVIGCTKFVFGSNADDENALVYITLSDGETINDLIDKINQKTYITGIAASIKSGKFTLQRLEGFSVSATEDIYIDEISMGGASGSRDGSLFSLATGIGNFSVSYYGCPSGDRNYGSTTLFSNINDMIAAGDVNGTFTFKYKTSDSTYDISIDITSSDTIESIVEKLNQKISSVDSSASDVFKLVSNNNDSYGVSFQLSSGKYLSNFGGTSNLAVAMRWAQGTVEADSTKTLGGSSGGSSSSGGTVAADAPVRLTEQQAIAQGYTVIKTAQDFENIINNLSGKYILMGDINLSKSSSIGYDVSDFFRGELNGNGYTISGLNLATSDSYAGLFAGLVGAKISNLNIEGAYVDSADYAGILAAVAVDSEITNVRVSGTVYGHSVVGGLVGRAENTIIENVYFKGDVFTKSNSSSIGGIVAELNSGNILNAYFDGVVQRQSSSPTSSSSAGGIVGVADGSAEIDNVFAIGVVTNNSAYVGGIVGQLRTALINNAYASVSNGSYDSFGQATGGVVGANLSGNTNLIKNSYYNSDITVATAGVGGNTNISYDVHGLSSNQFGAQVPKELLNLATTAGQTQDPFIPISAGTIVINGVTVNLSGGSAYDVLGQINAVSGETGVYASFNYDGQVVLQNLDGSTDSIHIAQGSSDFWKVAGIDVSSNSGNNEYTDGNFTTITGGRDVSNAKFSEDGVITITKNGVANKIEITAGMTVSQLMSKINSADIGVTAALKTTSDGKVLSISSSDDGNDTISISVDKGDFGRVTGFASYTPGDSTSIAGVPGYVTTIKGNSKIYDDINDKVLGSGSSITINNTNILLNGLTLQEAADRINSTSKYEGWGITASIENGYFVLKKVGETASGSEINFGGASGDFARITGLGSWTKYGGTDVVAGSSSSHMTESEAIAQGYTVIKTAADFNNIRNNLSGKYILMGDIDLSSYSNWVSIGLYNDEFTGELNGNGYTIKNLISTDGGLFAYTSSATIKNLSLENANITSVENAMGSLINQASDTTIVNVHVSASIVQQENFSIGGIVGYLSSGSIENSSASVDISFDFASVTSYAGGLAGEVFDSVIKNSYATGSISTDGNQDSHAGGLVGMVDGSGSLIQNTYNNVAVETHSGNVGGIVGYFSSGVLNNNFYAASAYVSSSYATKDSSAVLSGVNQDYFISTPDSAWTSSGFSTDIWDFSGSGAPTLKSSLSSFYYNLVGNTTITSSMKTDGYITTNNSTTETVKFSFNIDGRAKPINVTLQSGESLNSAIEKINAQISRYATAVIEDNKLVIKNTSGLYSSVDITSDGDFAEFYGIGSNSTQVVSSDYTKTTTEGLFKDEQLVGSVGNISGSESGFNGGSFNIVLGHEKPDSNGGIVVGSNNVENVNSISEAEAIAQGYTIIKTAADLDKIRDNLSGKYILMGNIDLSSYSNWEAIGTSSNAFTGELNGNGYTISNLKINSSSYCQGLFGYTKGAEITNLKLSNVNVTSTVNYIGALVGYAVSTTISNIQILSGSVTGSDFIGGLVGGLNSSSTVTNVASNLSVKTTTTSGNIYIGGLVGYLSTAQITDSYVTGSITYNSTSSTDQTVGGIVGRMTGKTSLIENTYSGATITSGSASKGGIVGYLSAGTIKNNFYKSGTASSAYAYKNSSAVLTGTNSTYTTSTSSTTWKNTGFSEDIWYFSSSGAPKIIDHNTQAYVSSGYIYINDKSVYLSSGDISTAINKINSYSSSTGVKALINEAGKVVFENVDGSSDNIDIRTGTSNFFSIAGFYVENNGTVTGVNDVRTTSTHMSEAEAISKGLTVIKTAEDFYNIRNNLSGKYILMGDIDLSGYSNWTPIGTSSSSFTGVLDGNGYVIKNVNISKTTNDVGLFGYARNALFTNLGLENVDVTGSGCVGALVGSAQATTISNVYVKGEITGTGTMSIGGIVGAANNVTITKSYAEANISASSAERVGGLVGAATTNSTINNSYFLGAVLGSRQVGGLVGNLGNTQSSSYSNVITNSYSVGTVNGSSTTGALIGYIGASGIVNNCFWNSTVKSAGYGSKSSSSTFTNTIGYTTAQISDGDYFYDAIRWDQSVWDFSYTSGTPTLKPSDSMNTSYKAVSIGTIKINGITINLLPFIVSGDGSQVAGGGSSTGRLPSGITGVGSSSTGSLPSGTGGSLGSEITIITSISIEDAINKINDKTSLTGVVASIDSNGNVVLKNQDGSTDNINLEKGTSDFFDVAGIGAAQNVGSDTKSVSINIEDGDTVDDVLQKLKDNGVDAQIVDGRVVINGYTKVEITGTSDFGKYVGISSGSMSSDFTTTPGSNGSYTFTGNTVSGMTSSSVLGGLKDGTFYVNDQEITVSSSDSISTILDKISAALGSDYISGTVIDGKIVINSKTALKFEDGTSNFAGIAGLVKGGFTADSNYTTTDSEVGYNQITGSVSGFDFDDSIGGIQGGQFTLSQSGKTYTINVSEYDTIGSLIDKINASDDFEAGLDPLGRFFIRSKHQSTDKISLDTAGNTNIDEILGLTGGSFDGGMSQDVGSDGWIQVTGSVQFKPGMNTGGSGGSGTDTDTGVDVVDRLTEEEAIAQGYTIIKTAADFNNIRNNLSGKYILMGDIDLSSYSNWEAIGTSSNNFTGELNGNGYVIKNVYIDTISSNSAYTCVGLFGQSSRAEFSNLFLENININIDNPSSNAYNVYMGTLVGNTFGTTISNVHVLSAEVNGDYNCTFGGLVGYFANANIDQCSSSATIKSHGNDPESYGGLVGFITRGNLLNSCFSGSIINENSNQGSHAGGLVGQSVDSTIKYSCVTGSINITFSSKECVGAIVGDTCVGGSRYSSTIENCFYKEGIFDKPVGWSSSRDIITNLESYNDTMLDSVWKDAGFTEDIWDFSGNGAPILRSNVYSASNTANLKSATNSALDIVIPDQYANAGSTFVISSSTGESVTVNVSQGMTIGDLIDKINATGVYTAKLSEDGYFVISGKEGITDITFSGSSKLEEYLGLVATNVNTGASQTTGQLDRYSTLTGSAVVNHNMTFSGGNFSITVDGNTVDIDVLDGESITSVINKINNSGLNITASIQNDRLVITSNVAGDVSISLKDGTSNFAELTGFVGNGGSQSVTQDKGKDAIYVSVNTADAAQSAGYSAGDFFVHLTDKNGNITNTAKITISENESISSIIDKINNAGLGLSAYIDDNGRLAITRESSSTEGGILVTKGTSDFTNKIGFTTGGSQSVTQDKGSNASYISANTAESAQNAGFSAGDFFVHLTDKDGTITDTVKISILENESISSIINKINNSGLGVTASINDEGKMVITRNSSDTEGGVLVTKGSSDFTNKIGFTSGGVQNVTQVKGVLSTYTSTNTAQSAQNAGISAGDFYVHLTDMLGNITDTVKITIDRNESISSIIEKINNSGLGVTASINDSGKMVITRNSSEEAGGILVTKGSSDFTNKIGFTSGGFQTPATEFGSQGTLTSVNSISTSQKFSEGDFSIVVEDNGVLRETIINVSSTDGIYDVIDKINAANAGVTAYLNANNKLVITKDADTGSGSISINKGSSDFTTVLGFSSGGVFNGSFESGDAATHTVLVSNKLAVSGKATMASLGITDGTFRINGVNITIKSTDTIDDVVGRINSVFNSAIYDDIGVTAEYKNNQIVLTSKKASSNARIEIESGSTNFTEVVGFTSIGSRDNVVELGQNAKFNIKIGGDEVGTDYDLALDLKDITNDDIYNGNNLIYLDKNGKVVEHANNAAITIEVKATGETVIKIGQNILDASMNELNKFVGNFNKAMIASENEILSDDAEFAALINNIKAALTDDVADLRKIQQQMAEIGIIVDIRGGTNSNMGTVRLYLDREKYAQAFYADSQHVMDLLIGKETAVGVADGVFTRLNNVLYPEVNNKNGYFNKVPRTLEAVQKELNREITRTTFQLNELKLAVSGQTGVGDGLAEYLAKLEEQYNFVNEAIANLNKQYASSVTRLILNQNNSGFNPIVT